MIAVSQRPYDTDSLLAEVDKLDSPKQQLALLDSLCREYGATMMPGGDPILKKRSTLLGDDLNALAQRIANTAIYYINTSQLDKASLAVNPLYEHVDEISDPNHKAHVYYSKSYLEEKLQNNALALSNIEKCLAILEALKDSSNIQFGDGYRAKGRILGSMGQFGPSSVALLKSKEVYSAMNDSIGMSSAYVELAILYAQIGLFDESAKQYEERYAYIPGVPDFVKTLDKANLARNLMAQKRYGEAKEMYQEVINGGPYPPQANSTLIYAYNGLIEAMYFNDDLADIPRTYGVMDSLYQSEGQQEDLDFLMKQSRFFKKLIEGQYQEAEQIVQALYASSIEKHDASEAMLHAQFLSELYKRMGAWKEALNYTEIYSNTNDSILTANKTNALILYQTQYETKEKALKIDKLAAQNEVESAKSRTYLGIAGSLAALLLIGGYLILQLRKTRKVLKTQNLELQSLNATKTKFFGIIGHDVGGPLTILDAIGNRIRRQLKSDDPSKVEESVDLLSRTSAQLSGLLDNLMKWALSENGVMPYHPVVLQVENVLTESTALFSEAAKHKGIDLKSESETELSAFADKNELNGILRNLTSNAIKFTPKGGTVKLVAGKLGQSTRIIVQDNGIGMSRSEIEKLQSSEMRSQHGTAGETGTGLGMMLVRDLVKLNRGTLEIESKVGVGTTITLTFPNDKKSSLA